MKKTHLEKKLRQLIKTYDATLTIRQGSHEVWIINGLSIPIPRNREINENTARRILKTTAGHLRGEAR